MKLEEGTVEALYNEQKNNPLYNLPVLQIISFSRLSLKDGDKQRYKVNLSDGKYYIRSIFSSDLTSLFDKRLVSKYSLIKLNKFSVRVKDGNVYLYVIEIREYEDCNVEVGNPVNVSTGRASLSDPQKASPTENRRNPINENQSKDDEFSGNKSNSDKNKRFKTTDAGDKEYTLIKNINPFNNKWVIKGRVVFRSDIKKYSNQKREGKLFYFELADESGQIKVMAFSEAVDIFFPLIEAGKVYSLQKGAVRMANKQFSNNNNDYEIILDKNSEIDFVGDNDSPKYSFNFVKISDIIPATNLFDTIGVIKEAFPVSTFINKTSHKEDIRRDVILVDDTGSIKCTFWREKAEAEVEIGDVIAFKSIRASEYNGVSLSTIATTQIFKNPDIPEAHKILGWYQENGQSIKIDIPKREEVTKLISEVKNEEIAFSTVKGTLMYIKEDMLWYESCKGEGCQKKVFSNDLGEFRCEKCNKSHTDCNYRYMISVNISDFTGQIWATIFDDVANNLFKVRAEDLKKMGEEDSSSLQSFIKKYTFNDFTFRLKSTHQNYNDEIKMRYTVLEAKSINFIDETKKLLSVIEKSIKQF